MPEQGETAALSWLAEGIDQINVESFEMPRVSISPSAMPVEQIPSGVR